MALPVLRIVTVVLLGTCLPVAGFSQGQPSSVCDTIKLLHRLYGPLQKQVAQLQARHHERNEKQLEPDLQAASQRLASLEATLAAEKARAASQGLGCY
jgi:hypothetical protein